MIKDSIKLYLSYELKCVCRAFGVPIPKLIFVEEQTTDEYRPWNHTIALSDELFVSHPIDRLCHEIAHAVANYRYLELRHTREYWQQLHLIADFTLLDARKYNWLEEYKCGIMYAKRMNLI